MSEVEEELRARVERLEAEVKGLGTRVAWSEAALILILSRSYGLTDGMSVDFPELRSTVRRRLPGLTAETNSRLRQEKRERTARIQFDARHPADADAFAGDAGTVAEQNGVFWLIGHGVSGQAVPLSDGAWIEMDPDSGRLRVISDRDWDVSDVYREAIADAQR